MAGVLPPPAVSFWDLADSNRLEEYKDKSPEELQTLLCQDDYGQTLLHYVTARGPEAHVILEWLIATFHDATAAARDDPDNVVGILNIADNQGLTALHVAAARGHSETISLLLKLGASISARDNTKATVLHHAALSGKPQAVSVLLSTGAHVDDQDEKGATPLHLAAAHGHVEVAKLLIEQGKANVDAKDWREIRPVHYAASHGQLAMFQLLKASGSSLDLRDRDSRSLLHFACHSGQMDVVSAVLAINKDINHADKRGATPLHVACGRGHFDTVVQLMAHGASVNLKDAKGALPAHMAAQHNQLEVLRLLLPTGSILPDSEAHSRVINAADGTGATLLHKAASSPGSEVLKFLLTKGARSDLRDAEGAYPLHKAAFAGSIANMTLLLEHKPTQAGAAGIGVDVPDHEGATPLHKAAFSGKDDACVFLLKRGANINARDQQGGQPLHNAAANGHYKAIKVLLEAKAEVNAADTAGHTAMHFAAAAGSRESIELLRLYGGDVNQLTKEGKAPLLYSLKRGTPETNAQLILLGAQFSQRDRRHITPWDVKKLYGIVKPEVILDLLKSADAGKWDKGTVKSAAERRAARTPATKQAPASPTTSTKPQAPGTLTESRKGAGPPTLDLKPTPELTKVIEQFNTKPRQGIQLLVSSHIVENDPYPIAKFLFCCNGLNKRKVGDYLGEPDDAAQEVLEHYVSLFDFTCLDLDIALRRLLAKFHLPGEAQKIDRIMQKFAKQYFADNADNGVFANSEAVYVLSFSSIILNTDAHNPAIAKKMKMTKEQFINSNKNINAGKDFPVEYLEDLFQRITEEEIKMNIDNLQFPTAMRKGWITLSNNRKEKTARRRFVILTDSSLMYFNKNGETTPQGVITLAPTDAPVPNIAKDPLKKFCLLLTVTSPGASPAALKATKSPNEEEKTVYILQLTSELEASAWFKAISYVLQMAAATPTSHLSSSQKK